ncbi:type I-E CRISPR-associated protein Cas6/Cse3/CasE [Kitasatospora brasiliensis]|uniref:type I-E CRISPR-associated protein Cas6/Cse3/CasE n=1 Tax=Kitasatospora brasiliensis TaxID=3058040 RepID=UPI00292FC93F|nr:type I-E CRISPR-associated protein Cas6/Cse3/CasE [Kitasatospora sp. K002]
MTTAFTDTARFVACHSILHLDATHALAQKAILDPHIMHRLVMSGFYGWTEPGEDDPRAQMGILNTWTLDLKNNSLVVIVQSRVQPDWSSIPRAALADKIALLQVDTTVRAGATYGFRIVVNPTRDRQTRAEDGTLVRKRLSDTTPRHVKDWFAARLQPVGTDRVGPAGIRRIGADGDLDTLAIRMLPKLGLTAKHQGTKIGRAEIKGTLTVTDPPAFTDALTTGIGRARSYSAGLLLIRPTAGG